MMTRNGVSQSVTIIKHEPKPGWSCPNCFGMGTMADGSISCGVDINGYGQTTIVHPTKCCVCNGKGRVLITAIPD